MRRATALQNIDVQEYLIRGYMQEFSLKKLAGNLYSKREAEHIVSSLTVVQAWIWTAHETGAKSLLQNLACPCCSCMLHKRFIWH